MSEGAKRIAAERQRQIEVEGWTAEHDATHKRGTLIEAARAYAFAALAAYFDPNNVTFRGYRPGDDPYGIDWPWEEEWWKPSPDPIRNLEKAGALIAAEIDRLVALVPVEESEGR